MPESWIVTVVLVPRLKLTRHDWEVKDPDFDEEFGRNCHRTSRDIEKFAETLNRAGIELKVE